MVTKGIHHQVQLPATAIHYQAQVSDTNTSSPGPCRHSTSPQISTALKTTYVRHLDQIGNTVLYTDALVICFPIISHHLTPSLLPGPVAIQLPLPVITKSKM
ncbi:hypothetical protein ILYODFUR_020046 [Ilyodon furcidens]|uniref:Uncharacterized protein n=1 Tax=Ilyodon furcidens TaxID=33524 RepID=A0ABV0UTJ9_9TELE